MSHLFNVMKSMVVGGCYTCTWLLSLFISNGWLLLVSSMLVLYRPGGRGWGRCLQCACRGASQHWGWHLLVHEQAAGWHSGEPGAPEAQETLASVLQPKWRKAAGLLSTCWLLNWILKKQVAFLYVELSSPGSQDMRWVIRTPGSGNSHCVLPSIPVGRCVWSLIPCSGLTIASACIL